ncbi:MAG: hypothetical protein H7296_02945 [Bacteroidia bacterium]|nr:hypothetical protein [Bacteroidia bacterium]
MIFISNLSKKLSTELIRIYNITADLNWSWFKPYLTYSNSSITEGLIYGYLFTNDSACKNIPLFSFDFLIQRTISSERIRVISNNGHLKYGEHYADKYG